MTPEFEKFEEGDRVYHVFSDPQLLGTVKSVPDSNGIFFVQWDNGHGGDYWASDARVALLDSHQERK